MGKKSHFAVIDIGGTKIRSALWDGYHLSEMQAIQTPQVSAPDFIDCLASQINELKQKTALSGIGVSTAGPVDVVHGAIKNPANLGNGDDSWFCFELKKDLIEKTQMPVAVHNDAAMTAWGQYKYCEKEKITDLVVVTLGTGLGVGAIVNGKLASGGQNMHPELGHFIVSDRPDPNHPTPFANFQTMESYLSGFHFSQRIGKEFGQQLSGSDLIRLSEKQNPKMLEAWELYATRMAVILSNLYLAYFPRKFVLAGGFAMVASPYFLKASEQKMAEILGERTKAGMPLPEIKVSGNHDELPLLGAGYYIQENQ